MLPFVILVKLQEMMAELATVKQQLLDSHEVTKEKSELESCLRESQKLCDDLTKKMQSAEEEAVVLHQRIKEKDEALQETRKEAAADNAALKEKLQANTNIVMNSDEMVSGGIFPDVEAPYPSFFSHASLIFLRGSSVLRKWNWRRSERSSSRRQRRLSL